MSNPYGTSPYLQNELLPWPMEGDVHQLIVHGEIPEALAGTYYRNGPNPQFPQLDTYHLFDGDGMIHAFFFEGGRCHYRNRWVRTARFELERTAGERIFNGLLSRRSPDPRAAGVSGNTANTSVVWHGGRLLALWEGGPPYELDPIGLETIGVYDFDGRFLRDVGPAIAASVGRTDGRAPGTFTAHPKIDPETGEMIFFGYSLVPPYLSYGVVSATGELTRWFPIDSPFGSMLHDFIVTDRHVVFPVFPNTFSPENFAKTGMPLAWEPERGTHLGVMPRDGGPGDLVWVRADPCNVFHFMNSYSEASKVVVQACRFDALPLFGIDAGAPSLRRWEIDPVAGLMKEEELDDAFLDFPRIDDRFAGVKHRYGYGASCLGTSADVLENNWFNSISHFDFERGTRCDHRLPLHDIAGEPIFVPSRPDAPEGDGFLLFLVYRAAEARSDLLVLDARNVAAEPLATIRLPHRIPVGFHGNWRPAS